MHSSKSRNNFAILPLKNIPFIGEAYKTSENKPKALNTISLLSPFQLLMFSRVKLGPVTSYQALPHSQAQKDLKEF